MINSIALDVYESYQALVKKIPAKRKKKSSPFDICGYLISWRALLELWLKSISDSTDTGPQDTTCISEQSWKAKERRPQVFPLHYIHCAAIINSKSSSPAR